MLNLSYTIIIVAITILISIAGFSSEALVNRLILWPRKMGNPIEYYRLLTSGFIHADLMHLIFNMYTLFIFGSAVESLFSMLGMGQNFYLVLYLSGIVVASIPSFIRNKNNNYYRSLGASGGVASIIFFTIYFNPWSGITIFPFPFPLYSIIFGVLYLAYEAYMAHKGASNVNHGAHFWGALYGFVFAIAIDPTHGSAFVNTLMHPPI